MGKKLLIALPSFILLSSFAVSAVGSEVTRQPEVLPSVTEVPAAPAAPTAPVDPVGVVAALGFTYGGVSRELVAQLGQEAREGVVVLSVQPAAPAAAAELQPFDVVLTIDGQPVEEWLTEEQAGDRSKLELRVMRGGVLQTIVLGDVQASEPSARAAFLSSQDLQADHPFRRAQTWKELGAGYEAQEERFAALADGAKDLRRQAREEAKQAAKALREQAAEQVRKAFAAQEAELLARIDAALAEELTADLNALALDLAKLAPEDEAASAAWFTATEAAFEDFVSSQPRFVGGDEKESAKARKAFLSVAGEAANLFEERVSRVWIDARKELERHGERVGPRAEQRAAWCAEKVEGIRLHLHERITCAYARAAELLDSKLAQRLNSLEVPAPGELETAVTEIHLQVETMAMGFVSRTTSAVVRYAADVAGRNETLVSALASHADRFGEDALRLSAELDAVTASALGSTPVALAEGWRTTTRLDDLRGELRGTWRAFVTSARDAARNSVGATPRVLSEHRVACDDAWRDVQDLLGSAYSRSKNDCWKLDGPHLDGRFPRRSEREGDVALLTQ